MINAKEAREKAAINKINRVVKEAENSIKRAVEKGLCEVKILCPYDVIENLRELYGQAGYTVTEIQGGVKIYWG